MSVVAEALSCLPRCRLAHLPTPIHDLPRLTAELGGPTLCVKRDDLTGLATGGNKTRKLEFLVADALEQRADCLITAGGPQSNHCRQTAAAAAKAGLACELVLGGDPQPPLGNLLLDEILGASIQWTEKSRRNEQMAERAAKLADQEGRPYVIPIGGSNGLGALGYVAAMQELTEQLAHRPHGVDHIVVASSSGGTQAGLVLGARLTGYAGRITAISIDQPADNGEPGSFRSELCEIANEAAALLGADVRLTHHDFHLNYDYQGQGYGVVGDLERDAIRMAARTEGLLVGPVYTGRAMGALIDLVRQRRFDDDETVLFWHTGDEAALHAYAKEFQPGN